MNEYINANSQAAGPAAVDATPSMLADGCPLVLTFKNPYPSKGEWQGALEAALEELRELADDLRVLHLLANTSKETTVVSRMRAKPEPWGRACPGCVPS